MMPDLVNIVGSSSLTRCSSRIECEVARAGPHREIVRRHGFEIVVEHVGPAPRPRAPRAPSLRRKSGVRISIVVLGQRSRMARIGLGEMLRRRRPAGRRGRPR